MTTTARLPRGRHNLTREQVARDQRNRILLAMAEAMAEHGYVGTSVAQVLRRAGVSRETFYQQFSSKEECFAAAYEEAVTLLISKIMATTGAQDMPDASRGRIEYLLGAYLDGLADEPAFARVFLIEVYAAGPAAIARRAQMQEMFVGLIAGVLGAHSAEQRFACQALAAAISTMVTMRLSAGDLDGLRGLRDPLIDMVARSGRLYGDEAIG
ncbi:MAG TPA: TetR/AcrR family transcriptional regulator [Aldersonia sp.]